MHPHTNASLRRVLPTPADCASHLRSSRCALTSASHLRSPALPQRLRAPLSSSLSRLPISHLTYPPRRHHPTNASLRPLRSSCSILHRKLTREEKHTSQSRYYCDYYDTYLTHDSVAAVRVPLLHLSNFQINDWPELSAKSYAIMVLMLPSDSARKWHVHELELVEVVADQVAVALSHAAILEESMRARDLLMEQNVALDFVLYQWCTTGASSIFAIVILGLVWSMKNY